MDTHYPVNLRGLPLGNIVKHIRNENAYAEKRAELEALGLSYEKRKPGNTSFRSVAKELEIYRDEYGHMNIPETLVIDAADERFPEELRGMKIGNIWKRMQKGQVY